VDHLDFRKQPTRIGRTPHRIGTDLETLAARSPEIVERNSTAQHQNIAGRIARQRGADHESRGVFIARHVLQRMHRGLQFAGNNRLANFSNECATLAAVRQQLTGLIAIARGFELDDLDIDIRGGRGQAAGNFLGLHQRHGALARADPDSNCHHFRSFDAADSG
jgi:hypothetical protein